MQESQPDPEKQEKMKKVMQMIMEAAARQIVLAELMSGMYASEYLEVMEMRSLGSDKPRWFVLCVSDTPPEENALFKHRNFFQ